ncbi:hypothetical protein NKI12_25335 [Mesorhizobium australicum]|uniref:Uncharacterized protein n=1 Tax=Mesorhizobium australicum TaxID=536018 RepID=A0ACC6T5D6_9HYPH|nr:hypothetical protein [Mesorhizobium sp. LNHC229A00]ESY89681.1 hypothetical protein X741_29195 [Mesorhizobium sp. LNHC229A00]
MALVLVLPNRGGPARGASAALTSIVLLAGLSAGAGPLFNGAANPILVFRAGMEPAAMMRAIQAADLNLKWIDRRPGPPMPSTYPPSELSPSTCCLAFCHSRGTR